MATGLDGIPLKLMPVILPCITHIYNTFLTTSLFPKSGKISKAIHIAKLKSLSSPGDYRPIRILPSLSKAIEMLIKDQIHFGLPVGLIAFNPVTARLIVKLQHSSMSLMTFTKAANVVWYLFHCSLNFRRLLILTVLSTISFVRNTPPFSSSTQPRPV
jgi:hypothetical protein